MDLEQKLKDFERKGSAWLERARAFILTAHQAENVALEENLFAKKDFLKLRGSNRLLAERRASVDFKKPWDFVFEFKQKVGLDSIELNTEKASEGGDFKNLFPNLGGWVSNPESSASKADVLPITPPPNNIY